MGSKNGAPACRVSALPAHWWGPRGVAAGKLCSDQGWSEAETAPHLAHPSSSPRARCRAEAFFGAESLGGEADFSL